MTGEMFDALMTEFNNRVSGEQVLSAIADQVRLRRASCGLIGRPMVTPYDVYRAYRDQNEKVSAKLVEVPVSKFLAQVPEPSAEEIRVVLRQVQGRAARPVAPTPGFKVPRQVQVEILSIDGNALARHIKDGLTEAELRIGLRESQVGVRGPARPGRPAHRPLRRPARADPADHPAVRRMSAPILASSLAEEKAQAEIDEKFDRIKRRRARQVLRRVPGRARRT